MDDIINTFMGNYFLTFLVIAMILFVITESIKEYLDFDKLKNLKKYTIIKNTITVIQIITLVATLAITGVSIYSMTLPSQY